MSSHISTKTSENRTLYPVINADSPGGDKNLMVAVMNYEPRVQCSGTVAPSLLSSCQNIVDTMPVSRSFTTWGPEDDPLAVVKLPLTYFSRKSTGFSPFQKMMHRMTQLTEYYIQRIEGAN